MAVYYEIDSDNELVRTKFTGLITPWDHTQHTLKLRGDPAFHPSFSELIVFDEQVQIRLSFLDFRLEGDPFSPSSKRALVASPGRQLICGIARMFQLAKGEEPNVRIFPTETAAEGWLGNGKNAGSV